MPIRIARSIRSAIRQALPRRRRRLWRYVSGRRHSVGVALLTLLVLIGGLYWHLTNDARVQDQVEQYLQHLTAGRAKVDSARFSLFGDITVRNLRIFVGEDQGRPLFAAPMVRMSHRTAALLGGKVEPTEIVCVSPSLTLIQDVVTGRWNTQEMFPLSIGKGAFGGSGCLPTIKLREGKLIIIDRQDGAEVTVGECPLTVSLTPSQSGRVYKLAFGEKEDLAGEGTIDTATGETAITGWMGLESLNRSFARAYRNWLTRHRLSGKVEYRGAAHLVSAPATSSAPANRLELELKNVSMEFPSQEGGLKTSDVTGRIVFDSSGIDVRKLSGKITGGGDQAAFVLSGHYEQYDADSPFTMNLTVTNLTLPLGRELLTAMGEGFLSWHDRMQPSGQVDVRASLRRDQRRHWQVEGVLEPRGLALRPPGLPIKLTDVKGKIVSSVGIDQAATRLALGDYVVELKDVEGRYGNSTVALSGQLSRHNDRNCYDLTLSAKELPLTDDLADNLTGPLRKVWDSLSPRGAADVQARLLTDPETGKDASSATLDFGGKASLEFSGFRYRLEQVIGQLNIAPGGISLRALRAANGPARATVDGWVRETPEGQELEIKFKVSDLPLDEKLSLALWSGMRPAYDACGFSGRADITEGVVRRHAGQRPEFDILLALKGAGIRHQIFPYAVEGVIGKLRIAGNRAFIEDAVGRHGRGTIGIAGQVAFGRKVEGIDLEVSASDLTLDADLRQALPIQAKGAWDMLDPGGQADVDMHIRTGTLATSRPASTPSTAPAAAAPPDYKIVIRPRDARVRYRHLPYPFRHLTGVLTITPGLARLEGLTGLAGSAKLVLDGDIATRADRQWADLRVVSEPVALDKEMLAALPEALVSAMGLREGGTVSLSLDHLRIWRPGAEVPWAEPASEPATGLAQTPPANSLAWSWSGKVSLQNAVINLGLDMGVLTGTLTGQMACTGAMETLSTEAELKVSSLDVGPRRLTGLTAKLQKSEHSNWLMIDQIAASTYGGKLAGRAEIRLIKPFQYGISVQVENIEVKDFLNAGRDPNNILDVRGLLSGNVKMTGVYGDTRSRLATGRLFITRAKIDAVPVLLGLLNVITLQLPDTSGFQAADIDYYLSGEHLVFREIYLQGQALSMVGSGRMNVNGDNLDLTFLTGPPRNVPRIEAISEVLQAIGSQIATVRVTGTLAQPKKQTVPLSSLDATIREILAPARGE